MRHALFCCVEVDEEGRGQTLGLCLTGMGGGSAMMGFVMTDGDSRPESLPSSDEVEERTPFCRLISQGSASVKKVVPLR